MLVRPPRGSGGGSILRPEELSKMFPTPPSLEHNPIASPCGGQLSDMPLSEIPDYLPLVAPRIRQDIYPNMGSPQEEPIEVIIDFFTLPSTFSTYKIHIFIH